MRGGGFVSVGDLTDQLGVTATAIRQRIDRLMEMGLIEREKVVAGRGRPTYRYQLTALGHRCGGANPAEFADAMWKELLAIPDVAIREQVLTAVAQRLGKQYASQVGGENESFESRMRKLSEMLASRHIVSEVSNSGDLPVLDIGVCPYPSLTDTSDDRAMCRLEEQMISEALGQPVHLSSCRLDGDSCCQFSASDQVVESTS
jgi:predicted ArsR family transcriptional regulator